MIIVKGMFGTIVHGYLKKRYKWAMVEMTSIYLKNHVDFD